MLLLDLNGQPCAQPALHPLRGAPRGDQSFELPLLHPRLHLSSDRAPLMLAPRVVLQNVRVNIDHLSRTLHEHFVFVDHDLQLPLLLGDEGALGVAGEAVPLCIAEFHHRLVVVAHARAVLFDAHRGHCGLRVGVTKWLVARDQAVVVLVRATRMGRDALPASRVVVDLDRLLGVPEPTPPEIRAALLALGVQVDNAQNLTL